MINYVNDPLEFVYNRGNNNDKEIFNSVLEKIVSERVEKIINEGFDVESADFLQYVAEITWNLHHNKLLNKPELNNLAKLLSKAVRKEFDVDYKKDERKFSHEHDTEFRTATYNAYTYIVRKLSFMDYPFGEDFWNKLLSDKRTLLYASYPAELNEEKRIKRCVTHLSSEAFSPIDKHEFSSRSYSAQELYLSQMERFFELFIGKAIENIQTKKQRLFEIIDLNAPKDEIENLKKLLKI